MHAIQLHATPIPDFRFPETVELQVTAPYELAETDLDDALAVVLNAVRQSKNPSAMNALGTMLAYMEMLEKKQGSTAGTDTWVTLASPLTMTF